MPSANYPKLRKEGLQNILEFIRKNDNVSVDMVYSVMAIRHGYSLRFVKEAVRVLMNLNKSWVISEDGKIAKHEEKHKQTRLEG